MKRIFFVIIAITVSIPIYAQLVCVQVIEYGLPDESEIQETSTHIENGIMNAMFDMGYIVSNEEIYRLSLSWNRSKNIPNTAIPLRQAKEGGATYLLLAILNYSSFKEADYVRWAPTSISFSLRNVSDGKIILEKKELFNHSSFSLREYIRESEKHTSGFFRDIRGIEK